MPGSACGTCRRHWTTSATSPSPDPYSFVKTAGPAHLSLADSGLTLATNGDRGVCLTMREPISGIDPFGLLRHPNLTVTVAGCDGLVNAVRAV